MPSPRSRAALGVFLTLALALLCFGRDTTAGAAQKGEPLVPGPDKLPAVFSKPQPESVEDLREIEQRVQEVVKKVTPAVVGIRIGPQGGKGVLAQGSGVIVDADGTVLTAGHVSGEPNRNVQVILPGGRVLHAKTFGRNGGLDSGMIKITDPGEWPHVEMGKSSELKRGQWVIAIGHPGGFRENRTPVVRVGRVLVVTPSVIVTDCTLVGGDSGGPLFDMNGRLVGIHSRIGNQIAQNMHVPIDPYRRDWERLAKAEKFGGDNVGMQPIVRSPGGKIVFKKEAKLTSEDPKDKHEGSFSHLYTFKMAPGSAYTIDMLSPNGKKLDPFLRLEDPKGKQIAEDDDGAGNLNARIVYRPVIEGEYRIIATTFEPGQTGPYTLIIRQAETKLALLTGKVDVLPAIHVPKQVAGLLLDKMSQAGGALYAVGQVLDDQGKPAAGRQLLFHWDRGGQSLAKSDEAGKVRLELSKANIKGLFLDVPPGLKVAMDLTDETGEPFRLNLGPDFEKAKVKSAGGKLVLQEEGRLEEGGETDAVRKGSYSKVHTFKMLPGSTYTIDLESSDFDSYLRLEDPSGKQLAEDDDGAGMLNSRIVFTPKVEGDYRIIVTTCDPEQSGRYRLSIYQAEAKNDRGDERPSSDRH